MKQPHIYGLIGYPLSHSFSKKYFAQKFEKEGIEHCRYELFPIENLDELPRLLEKHPRLCGLNVTIPYKLSVFKFLTKIDPAAKKVGAVNTIKIENDELIGYNTDVYGFERSLIEFFQTADCRLPTASLILGSGGAAKAVAYVLKKSNFPFKIVSRSRTKGDLVYEDLNKKIIEKNTLIINATPLGMTPQVETFPPIPYEYLTASHFLFDLVYNPEKTLFLARGELRNARTCNGLKMLYIQAEKAWDIWMS